VRLALFVTCVNDAMFPDTGKATVAVLRRLGHRVEFPMAQTCCGQPLFNSGYPRETMPLVHRFAETFLGYDAVVSPSASCVAMVHEHYPHLAEQTGDAVLQRDVASLLPRVMELSQLLIDTLGVSDVGASFPHTVTYHPACHGLRMLHLGDRYQRLLRATDGLTLVDLPFATECCGFGGTFAVKNAATSSAMVEAKAQAVLTSGAEVLATSDNSCLLNIAGALHRRDAPVRTLHAAEILATTREDGERWRETLLPVAEVIR
jgi:L-lactate dehydrogenase complex protein LldE